jgi:hypothetical protein
MNELQAGRMKRNPGNPALRGFFWVILPVANDRMT